MHAAKLVANGPRRHRLHNRQQVARKGVEIDTHQRRPEAKQSMRVWTVLRIHCARLVRLRKKPLISAFSKRNTRQLVIHCWTSLYCTIGRSRRWERGGGVDFVRQHLVAGGELFCGLEAWSAKGTIFDCDGKERCRVTDPSGIGIKTCCFCATSLLLVVNVRYACQGCIKRDPEGHADDFALQWRHYKACLDIFNLKPSKDSKEFADLVTFIAQVQLPFAVR